jgi:hypothetical protein
MAGIVYVMKDGNRTHKKIGWTKIKTLKGKPETPEEAGNRRERELRVGNPGIQLLRYFEHHNRDLETYLHGAFLGKRVFNEFFEVTIDEINEKAEEFFKLSDLSPSLEDVSEVDQLTDESIAEERVPTNQEVDIIEKILELRTKKKAIEFEETVLLSRLKVSVGQCVGLKNYLTYKPIIRTGLDVASIKESLPEIYEQYKRETRSRTLRISKSLFDE